MSGDPEVGARRAIDDARALLDALLAAGWDSLHVRTATLEAFIARTPGMPDPMSPRPSDEEPASTPDERSYLRAPHVATLVRLVALGTHVPAGGAVATLRVLDDEMPLPAAVDCVVAEHAAAVGDLLDFGVDVVGVEASA